MIDDGQIEAYLLERQAGTPPKRINALHNRLLECAEYFDGQRHNRSDG